MLTRTGIIAAEVSDTLAPAKEPLTTSPLRRWWLAHVIAIRLSSPSMLHGVRKTEVETLPMSAL